MIQRVCAILLFAAAAVVFLLHGIDHDSVEVVWGFFLSSCGLIVERLD